MNDQPDFSGLWRSAYEYRNSLEPDGNISEHNVKLHIVGKQVIVDNVPNDEGSHLVASLTLDTETGLLTGTWSEKSSPAGRYEGRTYYGAAQLKLMANDELSGKMVCCNNDGDIISGAWSLRRTDQD